MSRRRINISVMTMVVAASLAGSIVATRAAELTFFCPGALQSSAEELLPEFQRSTGHNVKAIFTTPGLTTRRVRNGEVADLAIVFPQQWEDLKSEGKLNPTVRVVIAKVGVGVFVKKGTAKPDISSVDAFKRALLNAKSIALADPAAGGAVGIYAPALMERLGISAELERFPKRLNPGFPCRRESDSSSLLGGGQHGWRSHIRRTCVDAWSKRLMVGLPYPTLPSNVE
jgi:molybdate transport system substrate-binding protein